MKLRTLKCFKKHYSNADYRYCYISTSPAGFSFNGKEVVKATVTYWSDSWGDEITEEEFCYL